MALPELPDNRRARPQRIVPGGPPPARYSVRTPPAEHSVTGEAGERGAEPSALPLNGATPTDGAPPRGAPGNGTSAHGVPANGTVDNGTVDNGTVDNGAVVSGSQPGGLGAGGPGAGGPIGPERRAMRVRAGSGIRPRGVPPQRGPDPADERTVVHPDLAITDVDNPAVPVLPVGVLPVGEESGGSPEFPGRHRRRAGQSPDSRPAAEYRAQADAAGNGRKRPRGRRRRENFWRELPLLIVVALLLTFLIQTFLAKVYVIPSGSMETTLHGCTNCNNDRVLVDKVSKLFVDPQPGDVVVFRGPNSWTPDFSVPETDNALLNGLQQFGSLIGLAPPDEKDFVKRVIAVGGQTVQCCDARNRVLVDGEPLDEPYVYYVPERGSRQDPFDPVTVPEGQLWMMGDSRNNSADSREPGHGPVPIANVIGQARLIVLPFPRFGWIASVDPHPDGAVGLGQLADGGATPLAIGLLGTLPFVVWRPRRSTGPRFLP